MKGGKGGRPRRATTRSTPPVRQDGSPRGKPPQKGGAGKPASGGPPKRGAPKKPHFGGRSSAGDE